MKPSTKQKIRNNRCPWLLIVLIALIGLGVGAPAAVHAVVAQEADPSGFIGYVKNRIVVNFDEGFSGRFKSRRLLNGRTGISGIDTVAVKYGVRRISRQFPGARKRFFRGHTVNLAGWHKVDFEGAVDVEKVVDAFRKLKGVIEAQPVGIYALDQSTNDPDFNLQWHLSQAGGIDIQMEDAWDFETGNPEIIVAVLDTGVRYTHKDLGGSNASAANPEGTDGNIWINAAEKNGTPGQDDDIPANGYVDDWIGWDFVHVTSDCHSEEDCLDPDNNPLDFHGHGTHVAGIAAAINNNGYAVASPAGGRGNGTQQASGNGVKIMVLRIGWSGPDGKGYIRTDFAAEALHYAADNGARLANASWESGESDSGGLGAAVDYFLAGGGLLFKAAGNNDSTTPDFLGGHAGVIKVAATDQSDCKADFSSYGAWVDISAPGTGILSTYEDDTAYASGTSMASPLALSVAALIWSQNPLLTAEEVKQRLFDSAEGIDGLSCNSSYNGQLGAGRINAFNIVAACENDSQGDRDIDGQDLAEFMADVAAGIATDSDFVTFTLDFGRINCP